MASAIDITKPAAGTATTLSVRDNFSAAKDEIEALQAGTITIDDATNSGVTNVLSPAHTTSGTPAAGIGTGIAFITETAAGNNETGVILEAVSTDVTATSEDFDLVAKLMAAGATAAEVFRLTSAGAMTITGGLTSLGFTDSATETAWTVNSSSNATLQSLTGAHSQLALLRPDIVTTSDRLGKLYFAAYTTGTTVGIGASVEAEAPSLWAVGDIPTQLLFRTCADGSAALSTRMTIDEAGNVMIGTSTAGASKLTVNDDSVQVNTAKTPASASATGTTGQIAWDASYIYICIATNTWQRVAHATW